MTLFQIKHLVRRKNVTAMISDETLDHVSCVLWGNAPKTTEFNKLRKRLVRKVQQAISHYNMCEATGKWLVCMSGGKDSYTLLAILTELKKRGLLDVSLLACNLDQGQPGFPQTVLPSFLEKSEVPFVIEYRDTYSTVMEKTRAGDTLCSLCSRLRRANLYRIARENGCSAIVLGHHRDDILETFLMNFFHGGTLSTMPAKLLNDEGDLFVLRPLAYVAESDCDKFSRAMNYPIIPCNLCGSQDGLQRKQIKAMIQNWEKNSPGRSDIMLKSLTNVKSTHLLDPQLFDFSNLKNP